MDRRHDHNGSSPESCQDGVPVLKSSSRNLGEAEEAKVNLTGGDKWRRDN
jgi:hypothetical protein